MTELNDSCDPARESRDPLPSPRSFVSLQKVENPQRGLARRRRIFPSAKINYHIHSAKTIWLIALLQSFNPR